MCVLNTLNCAVGATGGYCCLRVYNILLWSCFFFFFVQNLDLCNLHYIVLRFASAGSSSVRDVDRIHTAVALGLHDPACRRSS